MAPLEPIEFDSVAFSLPDALAFVPQLTANARYYVQAVIHRDVSDPDGNTCSGNNYSQPLELVVPSEEPATTIRLLADEIVPAVVPESCEWIKYVSMNSSLLSSFHAKDISMHAAVILPRGYSGSKHLYPVVYYIEGYHGTERYAERAREFLQSDMGQDWQAGYWPVPMIRVVLGSRFTYGHTSFADSAVNGPWETALVTELLPHLDQQFRMDTDGRFLTGHSSGGWASLWLQMRHPDTFRGTWSSGPDPVDFTYFQLADIYTAKNMYWDSGGRPSPTSRTNGQVDGTVRDENLHERVVGRTNGGQWDTFFAVFGPRRADGSPEPLFDKTTGELNATVAECWKQYDICLFLRTHPEHLAQLEGKIHVICGHEDNYYLDGACRQLQHIIGESSPCGNYVKFVAGDHGSIKTKKFYQTIFEEIAQAYAN